jgi:hypothetical protein
VNELRRDAGILAFSCYGQHHAIVFYRDLALADNKLMAPPALASILADKQRSPIAKSIMEKYSSGSDGGIDLWASNYIETFGAQAQASAHAHPQAHAQAHAQAHSEAHTREHESTQ